MLLTLQQMQRRLSVMTYRPGWNMRIYQGDTEGVVFELTAEVEDSVKVGEMVTLTIRSIVPPCREIKDFDLWVSHRLRRIEIHESMEWLKIDNTPLINPHRENADTDII